MKEFSILHNLKETQFLVDTNYEHGEESPFTLTIKAWIPAANAFAKLTMSWSEEKEEDYKKTFSEFKQIETAEKWFDLMNK